jgi:hypothetical protein
MILGYGGLGCKAVTWYCTILSGKYATCCTAANAVSAVAAAVCMTQCRLPICGPALFIAVAPVTTLLSRMLQCSTPKARLYLTQSSHV